MKKVKTPQYMVDLIQNACIYKDILIFKNMYLSLI